MPDKKKAKATPVRREVQATLLACHGRDKNTGFTLCSVDDMVEFCTMIIKLHPSFDGYEVHPLNQRGEILAKHYASDEKK